MLLATTETTKWIPIAVTLFWTIAYILAFVSVPSVLIQRSGRPQAALAWVLVLFLLPIIGLVLWWSMGRMHLVRKRHKRRLANSEHLRLLADLHEDIPAPPQADWKYFPVRRLPREEAEWVFTPTKENRAAFLINASAAYPAMLQEIKSAKHHVHLMFYIWRKDATGTAFRDALIEKVKQGVEVRLLIDAFGAAEARGKFMRTLVEAGAEVAAFLPPKYFRRSLEINFRNHRKLLIADGCVAITGGMNIGNEYQQNWEDTAVRLKGPVVDQLQEMFADDWYFATKKEMTSADYFGLWCENTTISHGKNLVNNLAPKESAKEASEKAGLSNKNNSAITKLEKQQTEPKRQTAHRNVVCTVVASGPHTQINLMHEAFFVAITQATKRIWITTPYFFPDRAMLSALRTAVFRGIDVQIIVPRVGDSRLVTWAGRSFYPSLLRYGIRMFEYEKGFLHSKMTIIDEATSILGSANMDIRSFRLNFEASCFLHSKPLAEEVATLFECYRTNSRELSLEEVESKPYLTRLGESAANLLSPLL